MDKTNDQQSAEEGVEVPWNQLNPETLTRLIEEFVSRDGADWDQAGGSLEEKVRQVRAQLRSGEIRLVFDLKSGTANLVPRKGRRE